LLLGRTLKLVAFDLLVNDHKELSSGNANVTLSMLTVFICIGVEKRRPLRG
jgi:hypothetical protein